MAEKQIRLPKWNGEEYYPATTTDAVADKERRKALSDIISDLEQDIQIQSATSDSQYGDLKKDVDNNTNDIAILKGNGEGSVSKKVSDEIAKVVAGAPETLDTLKEVAEYIKEDETNAARMMADISDLKSNKQDKSAIVQETGDSETLVMSQKAVSGEIADVVGAINDLQQEVKTKAPKVGYAPDLKVNFAKELVGRGEATEQVIGGIRPTGEISIGDGNATIERIKGESVVWNQWVKDSQPADLTKKPSFIDGVCTLVAEQDIEAGTYIRSLANTQTRAEVGEKWLYTCSNPDVYIGDVWQYGNVPGRYFSQCYFSPAYSLADTHQMGFYLKNGLKAGTYTFNVGIYNLTQMFGAGNEPTTIEEFEARKPLNVTNEYNKGTIISYDGNALKSVGFNAWDEEWAVGAVTTTGYDWPEKTTSIRTNYIPVVPNQTYEISYPSQVTLLQGVMYDKDKNVITGSAFYGNQGKTASITTLPECHYIKVSWIDYLTSDIKDYQHDICIHLTHSGYRNGEYQPYETDTHLLPDVKSILDANGNKLFPYGLLSAGSVHDEITATKAIKRVGVVDMGELDWKTNASFNCWIAEMPNDYKAGTLSTGNCVNKIYPFELYSRFAQSSTEKVLSGNKVVALFVRDSSYTTAADFKAAMSGVLLYYELAEPIEVDLPEPLNMTYEAWDFGTEELIAEGATTPLNVDIAYMFNAVDRIRENSSAIDDLEEHVEEHKNDGIELLTNGNLKLTLKGETREFMPATPSGDPMHYAYVSAGAEYNDSGEDIVKTGIFSKSVIHKNGYWYLNEIGDLTNEDMRIIFNHVGFLEHYTTGDMFPKLKIRTFLPSERLYMITSSSFRGMRYIETIKLPALNTYPGIANSTISYVFYNGMINLRKIVNVIKCENKTVFSDTCFKAHNLEDIAIQRLPSSISFSSCPNLSKESVKYMIENAVPTSAITITLHHEAFERLKGDADILQALDKKNADLANTGDGKGKVSLVCATDNDTISTE